MTNLSNIVIIVEKITLLFLLLQMVNGNAGNDYSRFIFFTRKYGLYMYLLFNIYECEKKRKINNITISDSLRERYQFTHDTELRIRCRNWHGSNSNYARICPFSRY